MPQRLSETLNGKDIADRSAVTKQIGYGLGDAEDWHGCSRDLLVFDAAAELVL